MRNALKHALMIFNGKAPIIHLHDRCYAVPSETEGGLYYEVDLSLPNCTHPHWADDKPICKHIEAARLQEAALTKGGTLESVPNPYKNAWYYDAVSEIEERSVYELLRCLGAQHEYKLSDVYQSKGRKNRRRPPVSIGDLLVLGGVQAYRAKPAQSVLRSRQVPPTPAAAGVHGAQSPWILPPEASHRGCVPADCGLRA